MKLRLFICLVSLTLSVGAAACSRLTESPSATQTPLVDPEPTQIPWMQPTPDLTLDDLPYFQPTACRFILPDGYREGEQVECGDLLVAETRGARDSRVIRLAVAIFHPSSEQMAEDPVIYLSGGPGASALEVIRFQFDRTFGAVLEATGRDLIVFDQRGVGRSQPALDCPEMDDLSLELADNKLEGEYLDQEQVANHMLAAISACRERLSAQADLSAYHSAASAQDVADLRRALGYERINLWSGSYGTRLALEVMRINPSWLRSVVLDAVYPPDVKLYIDAPVNFQRALEKFFESCALNAVCAENYPDLRDDFFSTVAYLNEHPVERQITNPFNGQEHEVMLDGDVLLGLIFQILYDSKFRYRLPEVMDEIANENYDTIDRLRGSLVGLMPVASRGLMFSVQCSEALDESDFEELETVLAAYPQIRGFYEGGLLGSLAYEGCRIWNVPPVPLEVRTPVSSAVPTLVMSGEFDPITPPDWGRHAAETLERSYHFEYPGIGHGASGVDGCPRQMMIDFIHQPENSPDQTCISAMRH
jgi:pimeloyl-ACP methyl ester carboxylesterase